MRTTLLASQGCGGLLPLLPLFVEGSGGLPKTLLLLLL